LLKSVTELLLSHTLIQRTSKSKAHFSKTGLKKEVYNNNVSVSSEVKHLKAEQESSKAWRAIEHSKFEYCGDQLKELAEKLHVRNKDIRIADSCPAGWDTVRQYKCNLCS
jgi:hypothetical protein